MKINEENRDLSLAGSFSNLSLEEPKKETTEVKTEVIAKEVFSHSYLETQGALLEPSQGESGEELSGGKLLSKTVGLSLLSLATAGVSAKVNSVSRNKNAHYECCSIS